MLLIRTFFTENALTTRSMLCKGIRIPESEKFLHEESRSLHFGIRNLNSTEKDLESSTLNPESTAWNPESKTVLDSLTFFPLSRCSSNIGRTRRQPQQINLARGCHTEGIVAHEIGKSIYIHII